MKSRLSILLVLSFAFASGSILGAEVAADNPNEGVLAPYLVPASRTAPEYPPAAYDARMEGSVTLAALVSHDGGVSQVEILDCNAPNLGFESAAAAAVEHWRFEPGQKDGRAIDAYAVVRLAFRRGAGQASSGSVTAAFMPIEMLRASIVAGATSAGGDGVTMASASDYEVDADLAGRLPQNLYDPKLPWVPERELMLDTSKVGPAPPFGGLDK